MHLVWSNSMPYLLLLFIKRYETDRSLDFWWKHILTGRGRYDLGELLIGTMRLQCRQLQCYQCLILLPVLYYFYLLVLYCLLSPQPASRPLLLVVDWSQLSDNTRGGVIHHHHRISFIIICFNIRFNIMIWPASSSQCWAIYSSRQSHGASVLNFKILIKLVFKVSVHCTCTALNSGAKLKRQPYKTSARQDKNPRVKAVKSKAKGKKSLGVSYKGRWCREER